MNPRKRKPFLGLAGVLWASVLLHTGGVAAQNRFVVNPDGTEVSDSLTGLTWRRCSEGQSYGSGTCSGSASLFTLEAALAHANTQILWLDKKTKTVWRLPNVKELSSIVDASRVGPAIDPEAFPATPSNPWGFSIPYWSSSPYVGTADYFAWYVDFSQGLVLYNNRSGSNYVRLVR